MDLRRIGLFGIGSFVLGAAIAGETLRPHQQGIPEPPLVPLQQQYVTKPDPAMVRADLPMRIRSEANAGKPVLNTAQDIAAQLAMPIPDAVPTKKHVAKPVAPRTQRSTNKRVVASAQRRSPKRSGQSASAYRSELDRQMRLVAQNPVVAPVTADQLEDSAVAPAPKRPGLKAKLGRLWRGIKSKFN
jgi:hypothetical protein